MVPAWIKALQYVELFNTTMQYWDFTVSVKINEMQGRAAVYIMQHKTVIAGQPAGFALLHHPLICLQKYVLPCLCNVAKLEQCLYGTPLTAS